MHRLFSAPIRLVPVCKLLLTAARGGAVPPAPVSTAGGRGTAVDLPSSLTAEPAEFPETTTELIVCWHRSFLNYASKACTMFVVRITELFVFWEEALFNSGENFLTGSVLKK